MASPRLIKKRLKSVKNIYKISKALEMVAASKVQKAQDKAVSSKPFSEKIYDLIQTFAKVSDPKTIPLLKIPEKKNCDLFVLVTTNRGLCGSLNTNLFKALAKHIEKSNFSQHSFISVGKKGRSMAITYGKLLADYSDYKPFESAITVVIKNITDSFLAGEVDEVNLVYNDFVSALVQEPKIKKILPIRQVELLQGEEQEKLIKKENINYNFEPSPEDVLQSLLPFYLEVQLREVFQEAEASEHSARMVAMKNASDNADQLSYALNLEFNKQRQQEITGELADIVTAGVSLENHE
ncbi:ATP synthase F1 subunit gamma [Candidatus Woesebacteria bacterium RBG_16_34_12]|uniref:ATP synthase gamma chain n=1 Tax=Candidatus Woesebacteria bacterium RBG_16_34_12 TaxID=1802480 RepID=A0A1F7X8J2_9BACT|nr:MAG: ATP synthase F1 subunit gamma [Candidatus Woesebacteria bacterium RBG_16_34_12]